MVKSLAKPGKDILKTLTPEDVHVWHMATGLAGEGDEVLVLIRGWVASSDILDMSDVVDELGDMEFYFRSLNTSFKSKEVDPFADPMPDDWKVPLDGQTAIRYFAGLAAHHACQVLELVKKKVIYRKMDLDDRIRDNLRLVSHALNALYSHMNLSRAEILRGNLEKLLRGPKARYPSGTYKDKDARDRRF